MAPSRHRPRPRYRPRCRAAAHRGRLPCRPPEIPRRRADEPPADRHPPDAGGAAPPARRLRPVQRAPSTGRSCGRCRPRPSGWPANAPRRATCMSSSTETVSDVPPVVRRIANRLAEAHLERARAALSGARFEGFDRQLEAFVALPPAGTAPAPRRLRPHACSTRATTRSCTAAASSARSTSERLHRLRIAIKKLRYAADFLRPAFAVALRAGEALYRGDGAPAGRARRPERSRGGGPRAGRSRDGGPSHRGRGPAAQGPRQAGGVRRQAPPPQARAGLEDVQEGRALLART